MRVIRLPDTYLGHSAPITHVDLTPDGRLLSTASYDGSVIVWDVTGPGPAVPSAGSVIDGWLTRRAGIEPGPN